MAHLILSIFEGASDYVFKNIVMTNTKTRQMNITYVYFTYDLIDKDLDFDEIYYSKIMDNFRNMLLTESKIMIENGEFTNVHISCAKLIMKDVAKQEHDVYLDTTSCTVTSY